MIVLAAIFLALALAEVYAAGRHHTRMLAAVTGRTRLNNQQERDNDLAVAAIFGVLGLGALAAGVFG